VCFCSEFISNQFKQLTDKSIKPLKQFFQTNLLQKESETYSDDPQLSDKLSITSLSKDKNKIVHFGEVRNRENKSKYFNFCSKIK